MYSYRSRCDTCRDSSHPVPTRAAAEREQDRHRHEAHGGRIPDGERIQRRQHLPVDRTALIALAALAAVLLLSLLLGH